MMVIVVIACLQGGDTCGQWMVSRPMSITECLIQSQRAAAVWQLEHPKYRVEGVNCVIPSLIGMPI